MGPSVTCSETQSSRLILTLLPPSARSLQTTLSLATGSISANLRRSCASASVSASGCASNFIGKILDIAFVRLLLYVVVEPVFKDFETVWEVCYI